MLAAACALAVVANATAVSGDAVSLRVEGDVVKLIDVRHGTEVARLTPVLRVHFEDGNVVSPTASTFKWSAAQGWLSGEISSEVALNCRIAFEPRVNGRIIVWLRLQNKASSALTDVEVPLLRDLRPGGRFTFPLWAGGVVNPENLGPEEQLRLSYPALASMQWLDYFTPTAGIYLGVHDPAPWSKWLMVGKVDGRPAMGVRFSDVNVRSGESLSFPPICITLHEGDWRAGADIYREWVQPYIQRAPRVKWVLEDPSWHGFSFRAHRAPKPDWQFEDLPNRVEEMKGMGFRIVDFSGWFEGGEDADLPDYYPGESYGGDAGMRQCVRRLHELGFRVSCYANGRLMQGSSRFAENMFPWSVKMAPDAQRLWQEFFEQCWEWRPTGIDWNAATWDKGGLVPKEHWSGAGYGDRKEPPFAVMCPGAAGWQALFTRLLADLVARYDVDGFFIDQVCGAWCYPCYDTAKGHAHKRPNEAWACYRSFMRELRTALNKHKPDTAMWTEGVNDLLGESFDGGTALTRFDHFKGKWEPLPTMFRYTVPEHILYIGINTMRDLHVALALGGGLQCGTFVVTVPDPQFRKELAQVHGLLRRFMPRFLNARISLNAHVGEPDWLCLVFRREDGVLVTGGLMRDAMPTREGRMELRVTLPPHLPRKFRHAEVFTGSARETVPITLRDGEVRLSVPRCPFFVVTLAT